MVEKITLENGVRIVTEHIPYVRSASVGLWIGVGSRHETEEENGSSHFIEHMLFKGTKSRSAADLAEEMDQIGGQMNAFTTKECTCFYGRVLDTHIRTAVDILADMFFRSRFDEEDVEGERGIIYEEIDMYEDAPDDLVTEQLYAAIFPGNALGRPILGTRDTLGDIGRDRLLGYKRGHYSPERLVVAVSGSFTPEDIDYIRDAFAGMPPCAPPAVQPAEYVPAITLREKPIEQNHLCLLLPSLSLHDDDRYALQLMSNILGGGMSSRLFQTVREKNGLCYSVYTFGSSYQDTGVFGIYTALNRETEDRALGLILELLTEMGQSGVTEAELRRVREQVKSNVLMSLESTSSRMNKLGKNELNRGQIPSSEEIISRYDGVTCEDILAVARRQFDLSKLSFSAVGNVADEEHYREVLSL